MYAPPFFNVTPQPPPKKKKEKPSVKTPIPGTDWTRVLTTEGNLFYFHRPTKQSVWTAPEEISEALNKLEEEETQKQDKEIVDKEVERVKAEVHELVKRKADNVPPAEESTQKKAKVEVKEEDEDTSSNESVEEEWQREAAQQLAKEAEEHRQRAEAEAEEQKRKAKEEEEALAKKAKELNMPARVDLSLEEAKALFKTLLREKDINPLHPWDKCLPHFISDPRYVLLPSVSIRREVFDEYCREKSRELRESNVKKEREEANPKEVFEQLLREEVKSTRTSWTDFRRAWKKDRRFWSWGRDDREREKKFRDFLKELGEKKRAAVQKAEEDFLALLRESDFINLDSVWSDVKKGLSHDSRYDAVGSSSLREELFNAYLKAKASKAPAAPLNEEPSHQDTPSKADEDERERARQRKEKAVKDREERVNAERRRVEAEIGRTRIGMNIEEDEGIFRTMLTDAIRDPQITWDAALPQLRTDPRFTHSPLPAHRQRHLFHTHVDQLRSKYLNSLNVLFEAHAPSLANPFSSLPLQSLLDSLPATKLGFDVRRLEREFEQWQQDRTIKAQAEFNQMLSENPFVEFWGRLGKLGGEGVDGGVKADDLGEDEGEAGGGTVDMKVLAKTVDVGDMEKVLRNDKRYIMFDHAPEQRERWIRDYISQLAAPGLSVHVPNRPT